MKKSFVSLVTLLLIVASLSIGCQSEIPVSSPSNEQPVLKEDSPVTIGGLLGNLFQLFDLPAARPGTMINIGDTVVVNPNVQTSLNAKMNYVTVGNKRFEFEATLTIPRGALANTTEITMNIDTATATIHFEPEGLQFSKSALLNVKIKNLDPWSPLTIVRFVYVNPNGSFDIQNLLNLIVVSNLGQLTLQSGKINHFSAYAFGRVK